jgi:hypothetical protein
MATVETDLDEGECGGLCPIHFDSAETAVSPDKSPAVPTAALHIPAPHRLARGAVDSSQDHSQRSSRPLSVGRGSINRTLRLMIGLTIGLWLFGPDQV